MADLNAKIIPLHSEVAERVPTDAQVDVGEIALNIADRKIYTKNTAGEIVLLGEGAGGGLPGGGFLPNQEETSNILNETYRFNANGTAAPYGWSYSSGGAQFDTNSTSYDRNGDPFNVRPFYQQKVADGADRIYVATEDPWLGVSVTWTELTFTSTQFDSGPPYNYFFGVPTGLTVFDGVTEIWVSFAVPGDFNPIPLADGDALRYDGTNWRPIPYRLESLDDVAGRNFSSQVLYWELTVIDGSLDAGTATAGSRVNLHPTDAYGVDRSQDFRDWRDDLVGSPQGPGAQNPWNGTLTFVKDGVDYPVTVTALDDDMTDGGTNQPAFQIECDFLSLYPAEVDGGRIELREFNDFLGLSTSTVGVGQLGDGYVLQFNANTSKWVPQALDYKLDDAADVALRVDSGSGTDIPKAVGDALLWDGSLWRPANPLAGQSISALDDVNTVTNPPTAGQALVWDAANGYWKPGTVAADANVAMDDLTDVTLTSPATGQFIKYQSGLWVNAALVYADISDAPSIPVNIGDLADVDMSLAPVIGQALVWDGAAWKPADQSGGGGGGGTVAGALTERADVAVTETYLNGQTREIQFAGLGEAGKFVQITASQPSWIRFYATAADRLSDVLRSVGTDPLPGSGVLLEVRTDSVDQVVKVSPGAIYYNNDILPEQTLYARVTNESGADAGITVTVRAYTSTSTDAIDGGTFGSG